MTKLDRDDQRVKLADKKKSAGGQDGGYDNTLVGFIMDGKREKC